MVSCCSNKNNNNKKKKKNYKKYYENEWSGSKNWQKRRCSIGLVALNNLSKILKWIILNKWSPFDLIKNKKKSFVCLILCKYHEKKSINETRWELKKNGIVSKKKVSFSTKRKSSFDIGLIFDSRKSTADTVYSLLR